LQLRTNIWIDLKVIASISGGAIVFEANVDVIVVATGSRQAKFAVVEIEVRTTKALQHGNELTHLFAVIVSVAYIEWAVGKTLFSHGSDIYAVPICMGLVTIKARVVAVRYVPPSHPATIIHARAIVLFPLLKNGRENACRERIGIGEAVVGRASLGIILKGAAGSTIPAKGHLYERGSRAKPR
jgi:hypothetical protein